MVKVNSCHIYQHQGYMGRFVEGTGFQFYRLDAGLNYVKLGQMSQARWQMAIRCASLFAGTGATVTLTLYKNRASVASTTDTAAGRIVATGPIGFIFMIQQRASGIIRVDQITSP
jgi:hypothetical protein